MDFATKLNLTANIIALLILAYKTYYDLFKNPRLYERDKETMKVLEAARAKRERGDKSTSLTFFFLAISYLVFIWGTLS